MAPAWSDNLDLLAMKGGLDFDAPSYITNQTPRYIGSLSNQPSPFNGPVPSAPNLSQPKVDEFQYDKDDKKNLHSTPTWKKILFGTLAAGALVFGGVKFKSKWLPALKKLPSKLKFDKVGNFFKTGWHKFTNIFHKKKSVSP